jgi:hypothetical protein
MRRFQCTEECKYLEDGDEKQKAAEVESLAC